jgi:hypothetical protein
MSLRGGIQTVYRSLDVQPTGQVVKASSGLLAGGFVANQASSIRYLKFYNKATAPTQADTPVLTIALQATTTLPLNLPNYLATFPLGLGIRASTGIADNDTGTPTANDVSVNLFVV